MIVTRKYIELKAPFKNAQQTHVIKVRNDIDKSIAFKVKTTAPKLYCVRPNSGVLKVGEEGEITIIFQGLSEEPSMGSKCKDKFLIVSVPIADDSIDAKSVSTQWNQLLEQAGGDSKDVKLKVNYNFDSPMNTIKEEDHSIHSIQQGNAASAAADAAAAAAAAAPAKVEAIPDVTSELKNRNENANASKKSTSIQEEEKKNAAEVAVATKSSMNVYLLAIIAIIVAFIVSRLM